MRAKVRAQERAEEKAQKKELKRELKREHTEGAHRGSTQREHTESKRLEVIHLEEEEEPCPVGPCLK